MLILRLRQIFKPKWPLAVVNTAYKAIILIAFSEVLGVSFGRAQTPASAPALPTAATASAPASGAVPKPAPAVAAAASAASAAAATPANPIVSTYKAEKVVKDAKGRERFEPLTALAPGDVIRYTGSYKNTGVYSLLNVDLGVGAPPGTRVLPGTLAPADGKVKTLPNGLQQVIWNIAVLDGGATQEVVMRLQVNPAVASGAASGPAPNAKRKASAAAAAAAPAKPAAANPSPDASSPR